ncbi:MAG: Crp/Fnr family transcriptional regulator [Calditrichaeota bacterium]|nr:MAG: Crp/Fnr family transcriptional regulator [Calditrichota bacterium]
MAAEIARRIPLLRAAPEKAVEEFDQYAVIQRIPAGQMVALEGDACQNFFTVLRGDLRVYKIGENGREVTLYHVREHESCILTIFCILSHNQFPAFAVAETDLEIALIQAPIFRSWVERFDVWRNHTFETLSQRLSDILRMLDQIAFQRVDVRVANYLLGAVGEHSSRIRITHEHLASELGTSRVVVSRILKDFEREGLVELRRGTILIKDREGLLKKVNRISVW